jgi:hypothetical protein
VHWVFQSKNPYDTIIFNFRPNPIDDLAPFARGYHRAGKCLAEMLEALPHFPDYEAYPILFLYRHALELYMKAIIYRGAQLLHLLDLEPPNTSKLFKDHRPSTFLPGVKAIFEGIGWTWDTEVAGIRSFEEFKKLVEGIEELDPDSYNFRYPTDTKGKSVLNRNTVVNVIDFSRNMDPILDLLDSAVFGLEVEFDATDEAKFEIQSLIENMGE